MNKFEKTKGEGKSMQNKQNTKAKVIVIAIAILLCLALAVGITGAFYQARRRATGTVKMDKGIVIDYKGFGKEADGVWVRENETTFRLFADTDVQPGEKISPVDSGIRANASSVDFYARVKLSYEFYNGETPVEFAESTKLIKTSSSFFGTNWVESGDGYFYYATDTTTLNKFEKGTQTFVDLFATDAKFIIEGAGFTGATSDGEGGGFRIDESTSINKIVVYLTLETLQGDVQTEELNTMGWKITASSDDPTDVIEDFSKNKLLDSNGDEIDSNSTDLIEDTIYQVVDAIGNGYKFTYKLDDTNMTATITGPANSPTTLNIPNKIRVKGKNYTVTAIGDEAFYECNSLTSVKIPNSITYVGYYAFSECQTLKSVIIPSGNIFCDYFLENYEVVDIENSRSMMSTAQDIFDCSPNLQPSIVEDGIAYLGNNNNKYVVAWKVSDTTKTSYTINDKCEYICDSCFYEAEALTEITIPDSVIGIAPYAFAYLSNLKEVIIGNGVKFIGYQAFVNCTSLESVTFGTSLKILGGTVFSGCSKLISINLPDSLVYVFDMSTFGNYDKHITEIFIGAGMEEVSWLPENVSSINITISAENPYLIKDTNNKAIFAKSNGELSLSKYISADATYEIPATLNGLSVTKIGACAFSYCSSLTSITIPNSVTSIGKSAFYGCNGLTSITIPDSVTSIGSNAFYNCRNLLSVVIENGVTNIGENVFAWCSGLKSITIPDSVTTIGNGVFSGCSSLTSIHIGSGMEEVSWLPENVSSIDITISAANPYLIKDTNNKAIFAKSNGELSLSKYISADATYEIPATLNGLSVTKIEACAFSHCSSLTSITIPDSVTTIGNEAFSSCKLTSITIPDSVTSIGEKAFNWCTSLTSVTIGKNVISIGGSAFYNCSSLTSITIPDSVTSIAGYAFGSCYKLTTTIEDIGGTWVKVEDGSAVAASTLLRDISYDIRRLN